MVSLVSSSKHLKKNQHQSFPNFFKIIKEEGTFTNSFYGDRFAMIQKPDKDITRGKESLHQYFF